MNDGMWNPKETLKSVGLGPKSEQKRSVRVAEAIRNELAMLLLTKVRDAKLAEVSFSRVQLADDLQYARIFLLFLVTRKSSLKLRVGCKRQKDSCGVIWPRFLTCVILQSCILFMITRLRS